MEDEESIRELVVMGLKYEGYEVAEAATGAAALRAVRSFKPDLVILDVMLSDLDGFEVCRRLNGSAPVIFLTARRTLDDKLRGLTIGADDYLTKPFSLQELHARVRIVLRRTSADPVVRLRVAGLELDEGTCEAWRDGRSLVLTPTEFRLLRCLMANAGQVLSKEQILDQVWGYGYNVQLVETYVYYLRRKLGEPHLVRTVRGFGYTLREH
ncbi:MAG TPA: response regulator transcription factor [Streptosporangiaceae bacterium]|nr:response regulator transcription factor [Streptosporangiaceae bacterium]